MRVKAFLHIREEVVSSTFASHDLDEAAHENDKSWFVLSKSVGRMNC